MDELENSVCRSCMLPEEISRLNVLLVLSAEAKLRVKFNIDVKRRRGEEKELTRNQS
jgi:hypothetical protein